MKLRHCWIILLGSLLLSVPLGADEWKELIDPELQYWEALGDGIWRITEEGVLIGYRKPDFDKLFRSPNPVTREQFDNWLGVQAWLYTTEEYGEFDLHVEYWVRVPGNSGISLRDPTRGRYAMMQPADYERTPAHNGYEVQISGDSRSRNPTGSIYTFVAAKGGVQKDGEWNSLDIESRNDHIRVRLNGEVVAEHPGVPERPKVGPIGLQLHDQFNWIMFRNIRIREISPSP